MPKVREFTPIDAIKMHEMIMGSGDQLVPEYRRALASEAFRRNEHPHGHVHAAWEGAKIGETLLTALKTEFTAKNLNEWRILSSFADGEAIGLAKLVETLPTNVVMAYASPEPRMDDPGVAERLKTAFKGTVGTAGKADFAILLDKKIVQGSSAVFSEVLGMRNMLEGKMPGSMMESAIAQLTEPEQLMHRQSAAVSQRNSGEALEPLNLYFVQAALNPLGVQRAAKLLNFQGASHYYSPQEAARAA